MALYSNLTKKIIADFFGSIWSSQDRKGKIEFGELRGGEKVPGHGRKEKKEILFRVKILNSSDNQLAQAALILKGIHILHPTLSVSFVFNSFDSYQ